MTKICPHPECPAESEPQPSENFYRDARRPDGLKSWCKACHIRSTTEAKRRYAQTEHGREKTRAYQAARLREGRFAAAQERYKSSGKASATRAAYKRSEAGRANEARYRDEQRAEINARIAAWSRSEEGKASRRRYVESHGAQVKARRALWVLIRQGYIPHPTEYECHECGKAAETWHHHLGYEPEHWYDVVPMCRRCHASH